jgi:hypothetical protein
MYLVTLFRIDSEIRIHDAVSQEIDKRVLKTFDVYSDAREYVNQIKNRMLMHNFPFAIIQDIIIGNTIHIQKQHLYSLDAISCTYLPCDDISILSRSTRKKLHDFEDTVYLDD